uniref:Uncharacterized protein n=1 Tax=Chenopodium quinoa TaxID=63459 RepID=A0A803KPJ9_CHEQI
MDLETENRIASILLKEAAEIRRQAQQDGALAYLRNPTVRGRPNSRFLTATVRGIQQVNRAVEVNEMWRVRQKEKELDDRLKDRVSVDGRVKRGRGSIGSRMDETGPFLPRSSESPDGVATDYSKEERRRKAVLGAEKPSSWKHCESSDESSDNDEQKRSKKTSSGGSKKKHSKKHKSKEKSRDKKRRKKDKRHKH